MPTWNPGVWIVTILILLVGLSLVLMMMGRGERERREVMGSVQLGEPGESVIARLGAEPLRCPGEPLDHLRPTFPDGWPEAAADVAIERLEGATEERWLFGVGEATPELCAPRSRQTEVGIDTVGRVVWVIAVLGRSPLRLPAGLTPAGVDDGVLP